MSARRLVLALAAAAALAGCGQKGPLCLKDPAPAAVPAAADSSAPRPAPPAPMVPGYNRCK